MGNPFDRPPDDPGAPRQVTPLGDGPPKASEGMGAKAGAKTVEFAANGRDVFFTVKFRRNMAEDAGAESVNMAQLHFQLLEQLTKAAEGIMEFKPTNKTVEKPPTPFKDLAKFPQTEFDHKNFFHRHEVRLRDQGITITRITHCYFGTDDISTIKKKIRSFLDENSIFIDSDEIKANETAVIGWFLHAHASMTHRPTLTAQANEVFRQIPLDDDLRAHLKRLFPADEDVFIPEVFAVNRMVKFGNSMSVDAVALCCTRRTHGFLKKLAFLVPDGALPYALIPLGFEKQCGSERFARLVGNHNVFVHKLHSMSILYLHPSAWNWVIPGTQLTMRQQFERSGYFHSIEVTESTARNGRHLLIVHADKFDEAEKVLNEFLSDTFRHMTDAKYLDHYQHWPHLQFVSNRNIDHQAKVNAIMARVDATEPSLVLPSGSTAASIARPAPSLFDLSAVQAQDFADTHSDVASVSTPATANTYASTAKSTKPSAQAPAVPADDASLAGRSVARSVQSEAVSTILSNFESVLTRQLEQMTAMMRHQTEFHRQQTEFQMRQAETTNKQMEMMLQLLNTMTHSLPSLQATSQSSAQSSIASTLATESASVCNGAAPVSTPTKKDPRPPPAPAQARKRSIHPVPSPARLGPNAQVPHSLDSEFVDAVMEDAQAPAPIPPPPAAPDPRNPPRQH